MKRLAKHQEYAVNMMMYTDKLALFYQPGTGKTMCALTTIQRLWRKGQIGNALIVCPASLTGNWELAIERMTEFEGFTEEDVEGLKGIVRISSFQKLYKTRKEESVRRGRKVQRKVVDIRPEVDRTWDIVVVDESHCIGAHNSVQTQVMLKIAEASRRRYIMTGTPVTGGGGREDFQKLYGQLKFLDPHVFKNWTDFCDRFVTKYDRWRKPAGYDTVACRTLMVNYGIFALLRDCYDMPDSVEGTIPCPLAEKGVYDDFKKKRWRKHGVDIKMAGGQYIRYSQICSGSLKRDDGTVAELKCSKDSVLRDLLMGTDDKVVVFCNLRASIDRARAIGEDCGRRVVVFDGRSKGNTWEEFQYGDADMIICQYQVGGAGLDLFASHTLIFFEPTYSALLLDQAQSRILRLGQTKKCIYHYLSTPGTFEEDMWKLVRSGVSVTNRVINELARGITVDELIGNHRKQGGDKYKYEDDIPKDALEDECR